LKSAIKSINYWLLPSYQSGEAKTNEKKRKEKQHLLSCKEKKKISYES
jgi:hypothetical protein